MAQGQFQTERAVKIGGSEMHGAKDRFFLGRVFVVDMRADLGREVRRHLGAAAHERALGRLAHRARCEAHRGHLGFGQPQQRRYLLAIRAGGRSVGDMFDLEQADLGVARVTLLAVASRTLSTTSGNGQVS